MGISQVPMHIHSRSPACIGDTGRCWCVTRATRWRALRRYDVAEGTIETSDLETVDESGAWRGLQWLNAFEILVR